MLDPWLPGLGMVRLGFLFSFAYCEADFLTRSRPVDFNMATAYTKNSLKADSPQMSRICASAAENGINVILGFAENYKNSLYIAQAIIGSDGEVKMKRRKMKPTHMERTIFGDASGSSLANVVDLQNVGRVGALACWEHAQPLLKYHTCTQSEEIHVAAWPPLYLHTGGPGLWSMSSQGKSLSAIPSVKMDCLGFC